MLTKAYMLIEVYILIGHVHVDNSSIPNLKVPLAPIPKSLPQQNMLPQENPFDIQSELIPYQDREVEPVSSKLLN